MSLSFDWYLICPRKCGCLWADILCWWINGSKCIIPDDHHSTSHGTPEHPISKLLAIIWCNNTTCCHLRCMGSELILAFSLPYRGRPEWQKWKLLKMVVSSLHGYTRVPTGMLVKNKVGKIVPTLCRPYVCYIELEIDFFVTSPLPARYGTQHLTSVR